MRKAKGFTLLEVLIAMLVTSIGLLGLAGLHAFGLRNNHTAYLRSQATILAYEIIDRMRANSDGFDFYLTSTNCPTAAPACIRAQSDLTEWGNDLAALLPGGDGHVCIDSNPSNGNPGTPDCDNASGAPFTVYVWWNERTEANPVIRQFVVSVQP